MKFLKNVVSNSSSYQAILDSIKHKNMPIALTGLSLIHKSHIIYSLCTEQKRRAFVVAADESEAQRMANDLQSMGLNSFIYPLRDFNFCDVDGKSREYEHKRLNVLLNIINNKSDIIITCIDASLQYTIPKSILKEKTIVLKVSETIPAEKIINVLVSCGYERYDQVEGEGQFSSRGGILDFFPPDSHNPVRIEFWGDDIDTISYFDVETQRRIESIDEIVLSPSTEIIVEDKQSIIKDLENISSSLKAQSALKAKLILDSEIDKFKNNILPGSIDKFISIVYKKPSTLFDYIESNDIIFISETAKIKDRIKSVTWQWEQDLEDYLSQGILCKNLVNFSEDYIYALEKFKEHDLIYMDTFFHSTYDLNINNTINFNAKNLSTWNGSIKLLCEDLTSYMNDNYSCVVLAGTKKSAINVAEDLKQNNINAEFQDKLIEPVKGKVTVIPGALSSGFEYPDIHFSLITYSHVFNSPKKKNKRPKNTKELYNLSDLNIGDYVVHSAHGIGIFEGIHKMKVHNITKDYIKIKYAKGDTLYVPVTQLDLVSKYIGPKEDNRVKINRLGGSEWKKSKARVKTAVKDIAKELIKLYSERMQSEGHAFPQDSEWQRDFESHFEHEETPDQIRCIQEIKEDMERKSPMDRLLCGDVGFGKTEVALRAAFKCVTDSKQCALLVPTTILAWQHFQTISKRFEGYPIKIEILSRFRTPKQQKEIIKKIKSGEIDLIVGTHRLVQKDVEFNDLGLVIIDEEQRFGVAQKERFKTLDKNVDILTLSATPIPRTLNMAMSGIRDMSTLEEAPQDRYPVQTYVLEHDPVIINEAIKRELRRGGQVFYLHNKVESIERTAASIQLQIPEASVGFGHGKMNESELSEVWRKMIDQEINVLVCTTIIETGIDLPNANTLIIENADQMGLSQLHQIRGRVGRSSRHAYAYFTFKRNKILSDISQKRLSAIREFTEFGSGFKIAMRDLEIRGAGNILGAEQHGNMEDVGYDMYLKLLNDAVNEEKGEKTNKYEIECLVDLNIQAHIPESYISNLNQRLDIYKRISNIRSEADSLDVLDELIDRFGDVPSSVKGLIDIALVRTHAASLGIYEIKQLNETINLYIKQIDMNQISKIIKTSKNKIMVNAGSKPYISIKVEGNSNPINILQETLKLAIY